MTHPRNKNRGSAAQAEVTGAGNARPVSQINGSLDDLALFGLTAEQVIRWANDYCLRTLRPGHKSRGCTFCQRVALAKTLVGALDRITTMEVG